MPDHIYIFYGYSGDKGLPTPAFPDGQDADKSFQLTAETLAVTLGKLFPLDEIHVVQSWTKDIIIQQLEGAPGPIHQVHIACHGGPNWLSLAYAFDRSQRLKARAIAFNAREDSGEDPKTVADDAIRAEDALVTGLFDPGILPDATRDAIRDKMADNASWQIWGCQSGHELSLFSNHPDSDIKRYLLRFNVNANVPDLTGGLWLEGVGYHIAAKLRVPCTAALGPAQTGLNFWNRKNGREIGPAGTADLPRKPWWLWNTVKSNWITWEPDPTDPDKARATPKPIIFDQEREPSELPKPKPPTWFTGQYWAPALNTPKVTIVPTFDGGPDSTQFNNHTASIAALLEANEIAAVFFTQTHVPFRLGPPPPAEMNPAAVRALQSARSSGHLIEIGSGFEQDNFLHTLRLPRAPADPNLLREDLQRAEERIEEVLNPVSPTYDVEFVRPVDGRTFDRQTRLLVFDTYKALSLKAIDWDIDSRDETRDLNPGPGSKLGQFLPPAKVTQHLKTRMQELLQGPLEVVIVRFHDANLNTRDHLIDDYLATIEDSITAVGKTPAYPKTEAELRAILNARTVLF